VFDGERSIETQELPDGWAFASPPPRFGAALGVRQLSLSPSRTSAHDARTLVRGLLRTTRRDRWVDAAELAMSEIVTNACIHARTTVELRVAVYPDHVAIEVRDYSTTMPAPVVSDLEGANGRGMALVAAVTVDRGISDLGDGGKIVWFCVAGADEQARVS